MNIPKKIISILKKFKDNNFQAYLVGGCVRDLVMKNPSAGGPKDWDITTNASPEQIQSLFPDSFMNNKFGTVTVLENIEITPFRAEEKYTDKRHPDKVKWVKTIEEDLSRRDFTVNAMAIDAVSQKSGSKIKIIDPYNGQEDLKKKIVRAVGNAEDRFSEDALRMIRAIRFAVVLDFKIEKQTSKGIINNSKDVSFVSKERIRDEFVKIIMSEKASEGVELLREHNLLEHIVPELLQGYKLEQNKHHLYDCYEHSIRALGYAAKKDFNFYVRMASLLHDIGKPKTKVGTGENATFYNHEIVGAKMAYQIMSRLKFSKKDTEKVVRLVRYHLFYYNVGEVTESSVRRLLGKVKKENIDELLQVRMADRIGSGCPKAEPYKLRHLRYIIEKVSKDPISAKNLKVSGEDVMNILSIKPGPKVGWILNILLGQVLSDPKKNKKEFLEKEIKKLGELDEKELVKMSSLAKKERDVIETKEDKMTKNKYWVT